ncbi:MAG: 30S ribosomal protein S8e [Candidatus Bathyarchaeia archaeon]
MSMWHGDLHKRKKTGGRRKPFRGKRAFERGGPPSETRLGERKSVKRRTRGGGLKVKLLSTNVANVVDTSTGKCQLVEIKGVVKNPANVDYQRRGIITKGAIISTPLGKAKVTSRPGQDGVLNAVLLKDLE